MTLIALVIVIGVVMFWVGLGVTAVGLIRNKPVRRWLGVTLAGFMAVVLGVGFACSTAIDSLTSGGDDAPTATATPAAASRQWVEIARWEGKATKETETFVTPREWRIKWSTRPGDLGALIFQIYVYRTNGELVGIVANVIGADDDQSVIHGAGEHYLTILNTAQPYTVVVEVNQ